MARLYFEEIDDETENEETEDIEATENIAYMEIEDLEDIDDIKATETFGEEEYREYFAHYEERKRIRLERKQRMRKQRLLKRFLCLGAFCVAMSIVIIVNIFSRKGDREEEQDQQQTVKNVEQTEQSDLSMINEVQGDAPEEADVAANEPDAAGTEPDQEEPVYSFHDTLQTAAIYSEEVVSTNAILVDESTDTIVA